MTKTRDILPILQEILERLERLENLQSLTMAKEAYTTSDVASRLNRAEYTIRQWCNKGQIRAKKVRGKLRGEESK